MRYAYAATLLEVARQKFQRTGDYPCNPRIADAPLILADMDWCNDFARYLSDHEYRYALKKKQKTMPKKPR